MEARPPMLQKEGGWRAFCINRRSVSNRNGWLSQPPLSHTVSVLPSIVRRVVLVVVRRRRSSSARRSCSSSDHCCRRSLIDSWLRHSAQTPNFSSLCFGPQVLSVTPRPAERGTDNSRLLSWILWQFVGAPSVRQSWVGWGTSASAALRATRPPRFVPRRAWSWF